MIDQNLNFFNSQVYSAEIPQKENDLEPVELERVAQIQKAAEAFSKHLPLHTSIENLGREAQIQKATEAFSKHLPLHTPIENPAKDLGLLQICKVVQKEEEERNKEAFRLVTKVPEINGAVFSGGGSKGIAYAGVLKALEKNGALDKIERVAGSSAGAMTALLVSTSANHKAVKRFLLDADFSQLLKFRQREVEGKVEFRDDGEGVYRLFREIERCQVEAYIDPENGFLQSEEEFVEQQKGWQSQEEAKKEYQQILGRLKQFVEGSEEIDFTFRDAKLLKNLLKFEYKGKIKDLHIAVYNVTKGRLEEYCYEKTPDFSRARAAQLSGAHPVPFAPFNLDGDILMDAGIHTNLPSCFLEAKDLKRLFRESSFDGKIPLTNLNFVFNIGEEIHESLNTNRPLHKASLSEKMAVKAGGSLNIGGQNYVLNDRKMMKKIRERSFRTVVIDTGTITTLSGLTPLHAKPSLEDKRECMKRAEGVVDEYFENCAGEDAFTYYDFASPLDMLLRLSEEEILSVKNGSVEILEGKEEISRVLGEMLRLMDEAKACKTSEELKLFLEKLEKEELFEGNPMQAINFVKKIREDSLLFEQLESKSSPLLSRIETLDAIDSSIEKMEDLLFKYGNSDFRKVRYRKAKQALALLKECRRNVADGGEFSLGIKSDETLPKSVGRILHSLSSYDSAMGA